MFCMHVATPAAIALPPTSPGRAGTIAGHRQQGRPSCEVAKPPSNGQAPFKSITQMNGARSPLKDHGRTVFSRCGNSPWQMLAA